MATHTPRGSDHGSETGTANTSSRQNVFDSMSGTLRDRDTPLSLPTRASDHYEMVSDETSENSADMTKPPGGSGTIPAPLETLMRSVMQSHADNIMQQLSSTLAKFSAHSSSDGRADEVRKLPSTSTGSKQSETEHHGGDTENISDDEDCFDSLLNNCPNSAHEDDMGAVNQMVCQLQDFFGDDEETSDSVRDDLAKTVNTGLLKQPNITKLKDVMETYKCPHNCESMSVLRVNEEIWKQTKSFTRTKDLNFQHVQGLIMKAMIPLVQITDSLMEAVAGKSQLDLVSTMRKASDTIRLMAGANADINAKRRDNFRQDLTGPYKQ